MADEIIIVNGLETRTWAYHPRFGYACAECCWKDRCDDDCTAKYYRPECPHCKGKGGIDPMNISGIITHNPIMEKNLHCTLTDQELAVKADQWIDELIASGGKSFTMQVPARPNADTDLIFAELNNRFKKLITELKTGPVWVKASDRLPEPEIGKEVIFINRTHGASLIWKFTSDLGPSLNIHLGGWSLDQWEWLDESATPAEPLPTFWDVAKAFKWAAEYSNERGESLSLYEDQWTIIGGDGDEAEIEDLTHGNVAELYCLQCGFEKESQATHAAGDTDKILTSYEKFFKECWPRLIDRPVTDEREVNAAWETHKRLHDLMPSQPLTQERADLIREANGRDLNGLQEQSIAINGPTGPCIYPDLEDEAKEHAKCITNDAEHQLYVAQGYYNALAKVRVIQAAGSEESDARAFGEWLRLNWKASQNGWVDGWGKWETTQGLYQLFKERPVGSGEKNPDQKGLEWLYNPHIEFCYRHPDGRVKVRYRRIQGTPECDTMIAEVDKLIELAKPDVSPYFYRVEGEKEGEDDGTQYDTHPGFPLQ